MSFDVGVIWCDGFSNIVSLTDLVLTHTIKVLWRYTDQDGQWTGQIDKVSSIFFAFTPSISKKNRPAKSCFQAFDTLNVEVFWDTLKLMKYLQDQGIQAVATFQPNRFPNTNFSLDNELKKQGRGSSEEKQILNGEKSIVAVKWFDNRAVHIASTFCGVQPSKKIFRWDSSLKKEIEIDCPNIIKTYNEFMGQVDTIGHLMSLYRIKQDFRSRFYLRIFFHYCDLIVINSWLQYRRDANDVGEKKTMDLWEFKSSVAENLCAAKQAKKVRLSQFSAIEHDFMVKKRRGPTNPIPPKTSRQDEIAHWPVFQAKGRCKKPGSTGIVMTACEKCNVHLCFTPKKNCFKDFHVT